MILCPGSLQINYRLLFTGALPLRHDCLTVLRRCLPYTPNPVRDPASLEPSLITASVLSLISAFSTLTSVICQTASSILLVDVPLIQLARSPVLLLSKPPKVARRARRSRCDTRNPTSSFHNFLSTTTRRRSTFQTSQPRSSILLTLDNLSYRKYFRC